MENGEGMGGMEEGGIKDKRRGGVGGSSVLKCNVLVF